MTGVHQLLPADGPVDLLASYAQPDPSVRVNFVASLDGAATLDGRSAGLSSPGDKELFGVLRALSDVVVVGAGTVRIERYGPVRLSDELQAWRREQGRPAVPPLAVVSASLDLDPASALFTDAAVRPLVLTGADAPADRRGELSDVADILTASSTGQWLRQLAARGLTRVLCEGGPRLFGSLLRDGHVDELCLTVSPLMAGQVALRIAEPAVAAAPRRFDLLHVLEDDGFLFLRYTVRD